VVHKNKQETQAEKVDRALTSVKRMNTVSETPLERALTDKSIQQKYPEAAKLLRDVSVSIL